LSTVTVDVIRSGQDWQSLEAEHRALFAASPQASPPLTWEWLWHWWQVFGPVYGGPDALRVYTVRRAGELLGVLPLYLRRDGLTRRLCFVSTGEDRHEAVYPEYLDLLAAPGAADACLQALRPVLFGRERDWDSLELLLVPAESPLLAWAQDGLRGGLRWLTQRPCCQADLTGGLEAYFGRLSYKLRKKSRRYWREVGKAELSLEVAADGEQALAFFEQLVALNIARWTARGESTPFSSPRVLDFHRRLLAALAPGGTAVLSRVVWSGQPLAVLYGFVVGGKYDFYQSGVCTTGDGPLESPGTATQLQLMGWLAERGVATYDFLAGDSDYKLWLATGTRQLSLLRVARPTMGGLAFFGSLAWHKWRRR
jgi:CelD/BcsL family acetyltransferase involved in cellulose biosynthesis